MTYVLHFTVIRYLSYTDLYRLVTFASDNFMTYIMVFVNVSSNLLCSCYSQSPHLDVRELRPYDK